MSLLENLPKEVKKEEFDEFLEKIKDDFPAEEFPEIFIYYQERDDKFLVLGIGKSNECAEQMVEAYDAEPSLKDKRSTSKMLRAPKTKFLLRGANQCR